MSIRENQASVSKQENIYENKSWCTHLCLKFDWFGFRGFDFCQTKKKLVAHDFDSMSSSMVYGVFHSWKTKYNFQY